MPYHSCDFSNFRWLTCVADNGTIVQSIIQAWPFLEMFFEAFRSNLPDWPFDNPRWRPFFIMVAILHLQVGVGSKEILKSADLNDPGDL